MLTRERLEQFMNLKQELKDLSNRINSCKVNQEEVTDSVRGSSSEYPYIEHSFQVSGLENDNTYKNKKKMINRLKKIYMINQVKIVKELIFIEYELSKIKDSEVRRIIRYRYEDGYNWYRIQIAMGKDTEYTARKKLERFFEKQTEEEYLRQRQLFDNEK